MFNLIDMCGFDRASDADIKNVLIESNERYRNIAEKVICRMLVYRDEDLYLLPYCWDRFVMYTKQKKMWRQSLNALNRRAVALV
jgi:hypothetical protein